MSTIVVFGWKKGADSITAVKAIRNWARMPLNQSLALVNRILDNETVEVPLSDSIGASGLLEELVKVGFEARFTDEALVTHGPRTSAGLT